MVKEKLTAYGTCQHWQQKDRPKAVFPAALIEAENQATRTPPPADLVTQPLGSTFAALACAVESKDSFYGRNQRTVARRTQ